MRGTHRSWPSRTEESTEPNGPDQLEGVHITAPLLPNPGSINIPKDTKKKRCDCFTVKCLRSMLKRSIPYLLIATYSIAGGALFMYLERDFESDSKAEQKKRLQQARESFKLQLKQTFVVANVLPSWDTEEFLDNALSSYEDSIGFSFKEELQWTLLNGVFYAGSLYTTIGYGNLACMTFGGQLATVFYAILGIPLALNTLNDLGTMCLALISKISRAFKAVGRSLNSIRKWCLSKPKSRTVVAPPPVISGPTPVLESPHIIRDHHVVFVDTHADHRPEHQADEAPPAQLHQQVSQPHQLLSPSRRYSRRLSRSGHFYEADVEAAAEGMTATASASGVPPSPSGTTSSSLARTSSPDFDTFSGAPPHLSSRRISSLPQEYCKDPPVFAAVVLTIGWLFICAGIFCFWEQNWTYWRAFYFFFISMSTIGLGDVLPDHPQYLLMNFGLVLTGLALVTVCIDVVQAQLENVYMHLLQRVLKEYAKCLEEGGGETGASLDAMHLWQNSPKAKLLMPLLSKDKRQVVMHKFQEDLKAQGMPVPPILTKVDPASGLPPILAPDVTDEQAEAIVEKEHELMLQRQPKYVPHCSIAEMAVQTIQMKKVDRGANPIWIVETSDETSQTEGIREDNHHAFSTERLTGISTETQTEIYELVDQTIRVEKAVAAVQTEVTRRPTTSSEDLEDEDEEQIVVPMLVEADCQTPIELLDDLINSWLPKPAALSDKACDTVPLMVQNSESQWSIPSQQPSRHCVAQTDISMAFCDETGEPEAVIEVDQVACQAGCSFMKMITVECQTRLTHFDYVDAEAQTFVECVDGGCQSDILYRSHRVTQTQVSQATSTNSMTQTESSQTIDASTKTDMSDHADSHTQTIESSWDSPESDNGGIMKVGSVHTQTERLDSQLKSCQTQATFVNNADREVQTVAILAADIYCQTDPTPTQEAVNQAGSQMADNWTQIYIPRPVERDVQTEELPAIVHSIRRGRVVRDSLPDSSGSSRLAEISWRKEVNEEDILPLHSALKQTRRENVQAKLEAKRSKQNLLYDSLDGQHQEKQLPVKALKAMFEKPDEGESSKQPPHHKS